MVHEFIHLYEGRKSISWRIFQESELQRKIDSLKTREENGTIQPVNLWLTSLTKMESF